MMKAFWWFKDQTIAGMARPGFNGVRWFDLPFDETLVFGWIGQRSCGTESIESLQRHFKDYGALIRPFHKIGDEDFQRSCMKVDSPEKIVELFSKVAERTECIEHFEINDNKISFRLNRERLGQEIAFLKQHQIRSLVTLTEKPNQHDELKAHFQLHHLAIDDLNAPQFHQAVELAKIIRESDGQGIAVHCMAGIGRTSTMLMAAHLILGEKLEFLLEQLQRRNPTFKFSGTQAEFVRSVALKAQSGKGWP